MIIGGLEFVGARGAGSAAPCVSGDPAGAGFGFVDGERTGGVVVQGADDDGLGPRHCDLHVSSEQGSLFVAALEVLHLARPASVDPGCKSPGVE